jgi:hypothetical protein
MSRGSLLSYRQRQPVVDLSEGILEHCAGDHHVRPDVLSPPVIAKPEADTSGAASPTHVIVAANFAAGRIAIVDQR